MPTDSEHDKALETLKGILKDKEGIALKQIHGLGNLGAYLIVVGTPEKEAAIQVSREFLHDLTTTPEYLDRAQHFFNALAKRMRYGSAWNFYCNSGVAIELELEWPLRLVQNQDATYVHTVVRDLRSASLAKCSVIVTGQDWIFDLERDPFRRLVAIVNTVRWAVDSERVKFFQETEHPSSVRKLPLETRPREETPSDVKTFIAGKVYWLGFFKTGDKNTKVWIADPWDAVYLGTDVQSFVRGAQILGAERMLVLDSSREFASADDQLLLKGDTVERPFLSANRRHEATSKTSEDTVQWDVFICHASEDKEEFVRPLAEALRHRGLRVWYDEFSLEVGDSLRQAVDRGLNKSRFGIVVLSPSFFGKNWPEWELNGLVTKELRAGK